VVVADVVVEMGIRDTGVAAVLDVGEATPPPDDMFATTMATNIADPSPVRIRIR
jgi:hypothetical protein